ncbi:HPr family phosphocarrier protein [Halobacillus litoralis]|uniref:HPr family phosphocarrier protein n=1 Tax=Halobacillus litoralis TaxID=45668 RepID=UPI001CFE0486|nr:HPr family phosphocarrier protein [Halobacillus litoralis]WLR46616.1 HPr family phosphocarrier protein [Halobacillus litoralis]
MVEKKFTIESSQGLHARPASVLVNHVTNFEGDVMVHYNGQSINLKSIMGIMGLAISQGAEIKVTAEGEKEEEIMESLEDVLKEQELVKN